MTLESFYLRLPAALQNAAASIEGWRINRSRFNARFDALLKQYEQRTFWNREQLFAFRDRRLRAVVQHAATTVPHYRDLFRKLRLKPRDVRGLDDLAQLPILTKQEIQDAPGRFRSETCSPRSVTIHHTSGSTGAGLKFPVTHDAHREQWAVWWRYRRWHGLRRDTACLYFGGRSVVPSRQQRPPFWRHNRAGRQILFSGYHLSPTTAPFYLQAMERSAARWIHGYPSLVALVAQYAIQSGIRLNIRWVTTGAESLLPHQARTIEDAFGVRPVEHYGMAEAVANVSECPEGRLHVDEDFAAVEFLPRPDGSFKIVGTGFVNPAFPLLRYDVGDLASPAGCSCRCGRAGRVVENIDGRREDVVITKSGARLGRLDHILKDCVNVRAAQIRQTRAGHVSIHVVKGGRYGEGDERRIADEARKRFGADMDFDIRYVDDIPRTKRGKLRFVVSSISSDSRRVA